MIYESWGFSRAPFGHEALPASGVGRSLLLGREKEISVLRRQFENGPKLATIEGINGIGKTSIIMLAPLSYIKATWMERLLRSLYLVMSHSS